ncbi:MAG: lytic transglycosylase domain-containing protein [Rhodobacterales bacterium]
MRSIYILIAVCVALSGAAQASSISKSSKSRRISALHSILIDSRLSKQYSNSVQKMNPSQINFTIIPRYNGKYKGIYKPMAEAAARKYGVPVDLFTRLIEQESGWNPRAKSRAGAIGLAQLMPATARKLGVNPRDPRQNLDGGARYLAKQYRKFGNWKHALAAYNAGPEAVAKYNGVPPYKETRNYVRSILGK